MRIALAALAAAASLAACAPAGPAARPEEHPLLRAGAEGLRAISGPALSARVRFLSDDLFEGRFTGSRGHALAERYVASELQAAGFEPLGEGGSYLLPVPLRAALKDPARTSLTLSGGGKPDEALAQDDEFALVSDLRTPLTDVAAPLCFAGYAVTAPEYGYDDLAGADLRGRIALIFDGAPLSDRDGFFPPIAHALHSDRRAKTARLAAAGAVGSISVFLPEDEEKLPWARLAPLLRLESMSWMENGEPGASPAGAPLRGVVHWKAFEKILARAGHPGGLAGLLEKAKANALRPFCLPVTLHGVLAARFRELTSGNVAGVLRGSDPQLAREYVVYTAHLDHLGIGAPVDGDTLYNGALDNASGVAAVLEIARAFAALPKRPARSIIVATVTGEERGLLGSEHFARHPPVPIRSIVANLNVDMLLSLGPLHDAIALGLEHSTLAAHARSAADALHVKLSPDPAPKQVYFIRSDQYRFVQQGVPALCLDPGTMDAAGRTEEGMRKVMAWISARYHSPKDEWDPSYDWAAMADLARLDFLVGLSVATTPERPAWNPGDLFARFATR